MERTRLRDPTFAATFVHQEGSGRQGERTFDRDGLRSYGSTEGRKKKGKYASLKQRNNTIIIKVDN